MGPPTIGGFLPEGGLGAVAGSTDSNPEQAVRSTARQVFVSCRIAHDTIDVPDETVFQSRAANLNPTHDLMASPNKGVCHVGHHHQLDFRAFVQKLLSCSTGSRASGLRA